MNSSRIRTFLIAALLVSSIAIHAQPASAASPCDAANASSLAVQQPCLLDQEMWINGGGDGFGGQNLLGQTFVPSMPGRVCKVEVMVHNNTARATPLKLSIMRPNRQILQGGVHWANVPPGGPQVVTFEFGCVTGPVLAGSPFYALVLTTSAPPPSFTWINSDDAGGDGAYPRGQGFANWAPVGYDYAFKVYMCH